MLYQIVEVLLVVEFDLTKLSIFTSSYCALVYERRSCSNIFFYKDYYNNRKHSVCVK